MVSYARKPWYKVLVVLCLIAVVIAFPSIRDVRATQGNLYVDAAHGSDEASAGSSDNPYKTITYALSAATTGDIVKVRPGIYDTELGERFPISMKAGVDLEGVMVTRSGGADALIVRGPDGGYYAWPVIVGGGVVEVPNGATEPPAERYVTIIGADDATLSQFVLFVTPNPGIEPDEPGETIDDGTGVLCNSTSPRIVDNRFRALGGPSSVAHEGIWVSGEAQPEIVDNTFFSRHLQWGISTHGDSSARITGNTFRSLNGIDVTGRARPHIEDNDFRPFPDIPRTTSGIVVRDEAEPHIISNSIEQYLSNGIYVVGPNATPLIQGNRIENNGSDDSTGGVAIWGASQPDLGGGDLGSTGGNSFQGNSNWDLLNFSDNEISASGNTWSHSPCCESIDSNDVCDDDEPSCSGGAVDIHPCQYCEVRRPRPTPEFRRNSLFLIDCGACPHCFEKPCDPRVNPDQDSFLIWDPSNGLVQAFSRSKLGLKATDGAIVAAAPAGKHKGQWLFVAAAPGADSDKPNTGAVLFFDQDGKILARILGTSANERLGLGMDVRADEVAAVSTKRLLRLKGQEIVHDMPFPATFVADRGITVAFTQDVDGDKRPEILLGTPYATVAGVPEAGQIQVIGSKSSAILSTIPGRTREEHLGEVLHPIGF